MIEFEIVYPRVLLPVKEIEPHDDPLLVKCIGGEFRAVEEK